MTVTLFPSSGVIGPGTEIGFDSDAVIGGGPPYSCFVQVHDPSNVFVISGGLTTFHLSAIQKAVIGAQFDESSGFTQLTIFAGANAPARGAAVDVYFVVQSHGLVVNTFGPFGSWTWEPSAYQGNLTRLALGVLFGLQQPINDILAAVTFTAY